MRGDWEAGEEQRGKKTKAAEMKKEAKSEEKQKCHVKKACTQKKAEERRETWKAAWSIDCGNRMRYISIFNRERKIKKYRRGVWKRNLEKAYQKRSSKEKNSKGMKLVPVCLRRRNKRKEERGEGEEAIWRRILCLMSQKPAKKERKANVLAKRGEKQLEISTTW